MTDGLGVESALGLERLESRLALANSPLPTMAMLESPTNSVVRIETSVGDIDFELFDSVAPGHVTNFLNYVKDGDYDDTFFHRLDNNFVLQGGGYRFDDGGGSAETIPRDPAITNQHTRSNLVRTIALARQQGVVNSGTSEFFINLGNNTFLDTVDEGFTVFGRVLGDASWTVVQTINALSIVNVGAPFNELPIRSDANLGDGFDERDLVYITDVEIIKRGAANEFYDNTFLYPEGFAGSTINEFLPISNPNNATVFFQVIVRSEVAQPHTPNQTQDFWYRDRVIFEGSINAHSRGGITISQFAHQESDLVDQGVPYAIEVRSTLPVSANLSHYDFGTATGEAFTSNTSTTWVLADARKDNGNVNDFLVWENTSDLDATLTIQFYFGGTAPTTLTVNTEHHRRGGLDLSGTVQVPDDRAYSIRITSTQPIVAALTHYSLLSPGTGQTSVGVRGNASQFGVVPIANVSASVSHLIAVVNPGSTVAVVTLDAHMDDGTVFEGISPLIINPGRRASIDLSTVATLRNSGQRFSIVYASNAAVYAASAHIEFTDGTSTPVAAEASTNIQFAEGFMDPARAGTDVIETLSIFNPNFNTFGATPQTANVVVTFFYGDGFQFTQNLSIAAGRRDDLDLHTLQAILDQGNQHGRFYYALQVTSNIPIVAQFNHYDLSLGGLSASGGFSTLGTLFGTPVRLDALDGVP